MYVFIVANGPGEIIGWVRPVAKRLKEKEPHAQTVLIIPPCQYASGREAEVAEGFPELNYVMRPMDYLKYMFLGKSYPFVTEARGKDGVCVFLGGDPFHTVLVSRRLRLPAVAYLQKPRWVKRFKRFMVINETIRQEHFAQQGVSPDKVVVAGDLMVDAVKFRAEGEKVSHGRPFFSGKPIISLMPGSRPSIALNMTVFFLRACELVQEQLPGTQFFLILSPFLEKEQLAHLSRAKMNQMISLPETRFCREKGQWRLISSSGFRVNVVTEKQYHVMGLSDVAMTIPGTNTAELACLGVPMVVAIPLNWPEMIPLEGFVGLAGKVPVLGALIKRWAVKKYSERIRFCAIPNIRAGKEIVSELRGELQPEDVAREVINLLQDEQRMLSISGELKEVMGKGGAADRVAEVIGQVGKEGRS